MTWELLWKISLLFVLATFAVMSALVTVLGAYDIRRMLHDLRDEQDRE